MEKEKSIYNEEPVLYCSECYSLKIKHEDSLDMDYCADCGCTEISSAQIEQWESLFKKRYGHKFVEKRKGPGSSVYFRMPLDQIKKKLYRSEFLLTIAKMLYPGFPEHLNPLETVILLFDKLVKDGRIDDLRYLLYRYFNERDII